ncbi:MAG: methyltransferase [Chloroflexi bacterium]|nr:MAG: methyltransferase [Chloroflexota bacterium]
MAEKLQDTTDVQPGQHDVHRLMTMVRGYMDAQVVRAVARLGLADHLAAGPLDLDALTGLLDANRDALARFLDACVALGLVERAGDRYAITPLGALLRSDGWSVRDMVLASTGPALYYPWARLDAAVRTGHAQMREAVGLELWEYLRSNREEGEIFARWMGGMTADAGRVVVESCDMARFRQIVDVGGSHGVLLAWLLAAAPDAHGVLFDRPEVIPDATRAIAEQGLSDRVTLVAGDFLEQVPAGADLYVLKSVLCDWDDEHCARILASCHAAAPAGATLLVVDRVRPDDPGSFLHVTDIGMLAYSGGSFRREEHLRELVERAGFDVRSVRSSASKSVPWTVLEARRV